MVHGKSPPWIRVSLFEEYKTEYDFSKVSKGDIITFGAYEQDANIKNGQEPIEWVVLSKTKSKLFVVSKYALDCLPYNLECEDVTWETCTLRKWLNEKFYSAAFNKTEQDMIKTAALKNTDNPYSKMPGGNDTKDKVFLLSLSDMMKSDYGFSDDYDTEDQNRTCAPTEYALARGILSNSHYANTKEDEVACVWWLRSPGKYEDWKEFVDDDGTVRDGRSDVYWAWFGVRPALYIKLNP